MRRRSSLKMNSLNRKMKGEITNFTESFNRPNSESKDTFNSLFPPVPTNNQSNIDYLHTTHPTNTSYQMPKPSAPPMTHNIMYPEKNFDFSF